MSAKQHLTVDETLELVEKLRAAISGFSEREDKLNRETATERAKFQRQFQEAEKEHQEALAASTRDTDAAFSEERERIEARAQQHKARITSVQKNLKQRRIEEINDEENRIKFEVQRDMLQTERDRDAALQATETAYNEFIQLLADTGDELDALEREARASLRGYRKFTRMLSSRLEAALNASLNHTDFFQRLRTRIEDGRDKVRRFRRMPLPVFFRFVPLWLLVGCILLVGFPLMPLLNQLGIVSKTYIEAAPFTGGAVVLAIALYLLGRFSASSSAHNLARTLSEAKQLHDLCEQKAADWHASELERIRREAENRTQELQDNWKTGVRKAAERRAEWTIKIDSKAKRTFERNERMLRERLAKLESSFDDRRNRLGASAKSQEHELQTGRAQKQKHVEEKIAAQWQSLESDWRKTIEPLHDTIRATQKNAAKTFPDWDAVAGKEWNPPADFAGAARFGELDLDLNALAGATPKDDRLSLPDGDKLSLPLSLVFPEQGSILFETKSSAGDKIAPALNNIILRLLDVAPPGRVNFTIIDPVELGQNFASVMHLADYEDRLISGKIWTQTSQIEERLANLNEHIEKVTQMYLRNEYATIADYNEQAGRIAEKYHFLVIADFPTNFSDVAAKRLLSIAASGPRCGVYTLIHWDQRKPSPMDFVPDDLRKNSVVIQPLASSFTLSKNFFNGTAMRLDAPPNPEIVTEFLQQVGKRSIDSNRVEMPFHEVAPDESQIWSEETTQEIRVPIGRTGATKQQFLALGKGTRQHALMAGKTGSGKSTLFHVIVTNLALWCDPDRVEFYLVDFKKGVEFKCYATHRLPHARVVAIESDREFGLSVLQRVDEELKRRGEMFRKLGVQDVPGYKKAGGTEQIPRTLLMIDEFQEFFTEDDKVAQTAALLLDRIVRQGRAFGIHVLLGSQTLGGAYTLARATLGQMVVRIALQCNEADAHLIMDEENSAPRLLSRPGEAIYNDAAGALEGNSPFQVVWLPDEVRDQYLAKVSKLADEKLSKRPTPIVFEGNAPAHVEENELLRDLMRSEKIAPPSVPRTWFGAPNSIKGPTEVAFKRQSGNNLLIVGQREESALALVTISLVSLALQHPRDRARFVVFDVEAADSPHRRHVEKIAKIIPHALVLAGNAEVENTTSQLLEELERRADSQYAVSAPALFVFIHGIQRMKKLRYEEDFGFSAGDDAAAKNPGVILNKLITEGASVGIHVLCTCDSLNNVNRFLNRKALSEFELRVLFQMSANDSATLIDSPKANNLGLHRAIFYNEQEGSLELFQPYALPGDGWLRDAEESLKRLIS